LLQQSDVTEFIEHLSITVEQVVTPESPLAPKSLVSALGQIQQYNHHLPVQLLDVVNQYWADQASDVKPLTALLHDLIETGILPTDLAIELVDKNLLQESSIISSSQILGTRSVRINTGLLYKQQKFNLLREENEGYAKLSHEFNLALSELPKGGFIDGSEITARSNQLLTVVNALIGYFELDPNRVLDNVLDICSQNLLSHARFILHFLHHSPWAPPSLAASPPFSFIDKSEKRRRLDSMQRDFTGHFTAEMRLPGGSKLAARLLGFKLLFFARPVTKHEKSHNSPESIIFLTALLLKSGFVKLSDLYPYVHLSFSNTNCPS
jgi:THO complex subunit 2